MKHWFIYLIFFTAFNGNGQNCKSVKTDGKWYGEFVNKYGTSYTLVLELDKVKKCRVSGVIRWPGYFNSVATIEGNVEDEVISFSEKNTIQGYFASKSPVFSGTISNGVFKGTTADRGDETGSFEVTNSEFINEEDLSKYRELTESNQDKFGLTVVGDKVSIDTAKVIAQQYIYDSASYNIGPMRAEGISSYGDIEFDFTMSLIYPYWLRTDLEFSGVTFVNSSNDTKTWSYDSNEDKVYVSELEDTSEYRMSTHFVKSHRAGYAINSVKFASVDGVPTYRFHFQKEEDIRMIYLDTSDFIIVREELNSQIQQYNGPFLFEGALWMKEMVQMDDQNVSKYAYDTVYLDNSLTKDFFEIPDELKLKIDRSGEFESDFYTKAEEAYAEGNYESAIEFYTKAININSNNVDYYYSRAMSKKSIQDYYGALSDLESALQLSPKTPLYHNQKGTIKYALGDYANAMKDFNKAIEVDSSYAMGYYNLGFSVAKSKDFRGAKNYFDTAIKFDSTNGGFYFNRGIMLAELGSYDSASTDYLKTLQLEYEDKGAVYNRIGVIRYRKEEYKEAAAMFDSAYSFEAKPTYLQNVAYANYYDENYEGSIELFEKLIEDFPENHAYHNNLGYCFFNIEDYDGAIFHFDKAIELHKSSGQYYQNRAFAKSKLGKYTEAIEDFSQAIRLDPEESENYYQVGQIHELQHNKFDACIYYNKAIEFGYETTDEMTELCQLKKD